DAQGMQMTAQRFHPSRGRLVDIGGRRIRATPAGPQTDRPLIVLECGAFGCAADWAVVQDRLARRGVYSLAYDRAGLGYSDPGPTPRDGRAIASDLEALLAHAGETGPLIMVGHSMGGLLLRVFVGRNRQRVAGVVLVDAVTPEAIETPTAARAIHAYRRAMKLVGRYAGIGFMRPVSMVMGDMIGLEGEASSEKRRIYGLASHARWAAEEVSHWPETSAQGREIGPYDPVMPVAVVTAGATRVGARLKAIQTAPAQASHHGYVADIAGAGHASLLGKRFADPIISGIDHVLAAA
ncbi:MAG TPA: alpha/beta hydrolase, partial [Phenylobacterium sp.]|nr:alpha/beta hydrolase [Phenylobacterium sp.]